MSVRLLALSALLSIGVSSTSPAQMARDSIALLAVEGLSQGETIRIAAQGGYSVGWFQGMRGDAVQLGARNREPLTIPLSDVDTVWRRATRAGRGAKIGVVSGALLGGYAGMVFIGLAGAEGGSTNRIGGNEVAGGLVGALAGAATGALLGAGIGAAFKYWKRVDP